MAASWGERGSFVASLSEDDRKALADAGTRRRYPKGTTLFTEGAHSERVLVIAEGRVKMSLFTEEGKEVVLAVRGPGELIGEMSALDGSPLSASAFALDDVDVVSVGGGDFIRFLEQHATAGITLLRMLASRLRDADKQRVEFLAYDTTGRVARRLLELSERYGKTNGEGVRIDLPLSQEELAGWTGSSREAVSKALQALRSRGLIETHRRGITVVDVDGLRRRAT